MISDGSRHRHDPGVRVPPFAAIRAAEIGGRPAAAVVAIPLAPGSASCAPPLPAASDTLSRRTPGAVRAASASRWSRCPAGPAVHPASVAASSSSQQVVTPLRRPAPGRRDAPAAASAAMTIASAVAPRRQGQSMAHEKSPQERHEGTTRGESRRRYCPSDFRMSAFVASRSGFSECTDRIFSGSSFSRSMFSRKTIVPTTGGFGTGLSAGGRLNMSA